MMLCLPLLACNYLDVVPDGTATLESAFTMRDHAMRYMLGIYSFLPNHARAETPDIQGCDEGWILDDPSYIQDIARYGCRVVRGQLSPSVSIGGITDRWSRYYTAIRECNTFLDGMEEYPIPDLEISERLQWIGEVKALKAWYHFLLVRHYGPIPLIRENLPVSTSIEDVQTPRNTIDEAIEHITQLFDEAMETLPARVRSETSDLGRITLPIAAAMKAKALVTLASPLFNCNSEFAPMRNVDGTQLFPQDESQRLVKWKNAVEACRQAIYICQDSLGMKLYQYPGDPRYNLTDTILQQMTLRMAICEEWNSELIWGETRQEVYWIDWRCAPVLNPIYDAQPQMAEVFSTPLQIAEMFYSENGVPIEEDKFWGYDDRYTVRRGTDIDQLYIRNGAETSYSNFNREPRFYAWLGFDKGIWYGSGSYDDSQPAELYHYNLRGFRPNNMRESTGYVPKKLVHPHSLQPASLNYTPYGYVWPNFRLTDLYLLYAEALNEAEDNQTARQEAMQYVDLIRDRAGLKSIAEAWTTYSNNSQKFNSQTGLREIIQRERTIEMFMEGQRFWDLRRWKTAREHLNKPILSWCGFNSTAEDHFKPYNMHIISFGLKDYFWPISENELTRNRNLVQSLGW
jgi:hypothetical protein